MNKYANASSVHRAGRIKKKEEPNLSIIFIILLPFSTLAVVAIAPFLKHAQ